MTLLSRYTDGNARRANRAYHVLRQAAGHILDANGDGLYRRVSDVLLVLLQ